MKDFSIKYPILNEIRKHKSDQVPLFPSQFNIYFLFYNDKLVYIGRSSNLFARLSKHLTTKIFNSLSLVPTNRADLIELETYYIEKYEPSYNHQEATVKQFRTRRTKLQQKKQR